MKILKDYIDKIKPHFEKGGKFEMLHSTFDGIETFLFVPDTVTKKGSHIRDCNDMKRVMIIVVVALIPSLLFGMYNVGLQHFSAFGDVAAAANILTCFWFGFLKVLPLVIVSYGVGLGIEFAFAQVRGHEISEGFLVSGMLIPLIMPVDVPLWMVAVATAFAVVIGKEVFGGSGMNIFNPALLARAFVFFAYTSSISGEKVWISGVSENGDALVDGFSGATPLTALSGSADWSSISMMDSLIGTVPGSIGETSFIAIMLGAGILLYTGIASWRIMGSVFVGGLAMGLLFNLIGGESTSYLTMPAYYHLLLGGFAFGAVFMATDPVSGSQTNTGKYIYGALIGIITVLTRVINPGYPEGMMLAILLLNALAPLIDHYVVEANISRRNRRLKRA